MQVRLLSEQILRVHAEETVGERLLSVFSRIVLDRRRPLIQNQHKNSFNPVLRTKLGNCAIHFGISGIQQVPHPS